MYLELRLMRIFSFLCWVWFLQNLSTQPKVSNCICSQNDSPTSPFIFFHVSFKVCSCRAGWEGATWGAERTASECQRKWGSEFSWAIRERGDLELVPLWASHSSSTEGRIWSRFLSSQMRCYREIIYNKIKYLQLSDCIIGEIITFKRKIWNVGEFLKMQQSHLFECVFPNPDGHLEVKN